VGLNCRLGPYHMIKSLEQVNIPQRAYLSAYPNAGFPIFRDGKFQFEKNAEYFRANAHAFRKQGVRLIGGCCGTTPAHIKALADELKGASVIVEKEIKVEVRDRVVVKPNEPLRTELPLQTIVKQRPSVIVELDPPRKLHT